MKLILREWDRLGIYLLLMAFGGYSTIYPIVSFERASPQWGPITLGSEFFIAGVLLIIGMGKRKGYRMAGLAVVALGLTTISLVIGVQGGEKVLAYAFLFGAFAMQSVSDIRQERRTRRREKAESELLREAVQLLTSESRQGDDR